jgi:hypothetical protein
MQDRLEHLEVGGPAERPLSREQLVQHDPEREDVAAHVERFPERLFRRHVGNGPHHDAGPGQRQLGARDAVRRRRVLEAREAEVGELGVAAARHEDVARLDIAVQDPGGMRGGQRVGHAHHQVDDLAPRPLVGARPLVQRAAVDVLRREEQTMLELAGLVHGHEMGMVER